MGKRLRFVLVPGIGFCLACVAISVSDSSADPTASASYCPTIIDRCAGGGARNEVEVALNSSFKPARLPKKKLAPVHFSVEGTIGKPDGSHPPPLRELDLEIDKNVALDPLGLPACGLGKIKVATTSQALKACSPALVGKGALEVVVAYPEQSPLMPKSTLLAFNGGVKNGKATVYIHTYLFTPVSAPVVMTATVSKVHYGPYGIKLEISIPPIAKGSGFVKKFQLEFFRRFVYRQKKQSFAKARCFDGKFQAKATFIFFEGPPLVGAFKRPCTPQP